MADKLATQFTPVTNPDGARGMLLFDPVTGERQRLTITQFFDDVPSPVTFSGSVIHTSSTRLRSVAARLDLQITADTDRTMRLTNGVDGLLPSIQGFTASNVATDIISWTHGVSDGNRIITIGQNGQTTEFGGDISASRGTFTSDSVQPMTINRLGSNGSALKVQKDTVLIGDIHARATSMRITSVAGIDLQLGANGNDGDVVIDTNGDVTVLSLAGAGTRYVYADANGKLSATVAVP